MSKPIKGLVVEALKEQYAQVDSVCVVDLTGMDVKSTEQLRSVLRDKSARMQVVRNSLARRAFVDGPLAPLAQELEGPCAFVSSTESIVDVAKLLVEFCKEHENLTLKQALLDGEPQLLTVAEMSKLRSWSEMLGEVALVIVSPARSVAGCVASPQSKIAGCLKAITEKAA